MKRVSWIIVLLAFLSCKKSNNPDAIRLLGTGSTDNAGNVLHTTYNYDGQGRMTGITRYKNNETPVVAVTISYNGNEVLLHSSPDTDPSYIQHTEVRLTLDAAGKLLKRIEYTYKQLDVSSPNPPVTFMYDTLVCEYEAAGLLMKITGSRQDSTWSGPSYNEVTRSTYTGNYTTSGGNLTASDEYWTYPRTVRNGGVTTLAGGSSEYHNVFRYTRGFPNRTDFKNAAILNEYRLYYEPAMNAGYKNMPDQVTRSSTDRDISGTIIFNGSTTIDINRVYNADGFLSSVIILSANTPYRTIDYFYSN